MLCLLHPTVVICGNYIIIIFSLIQYDLSYVTRMFLETRHTFSLPHMMYLISCTKAANTLINLGATSSWQSIIVTLRYLFSLWAWRWYHVNIVAIQIVVGCSKHLNIRLWRLLSLQHPGFTLMRRHWEFFISTEHKLLKQFPCMISNMDLFIEYPLGALTEHHGILKAKTTDQDSGQARVQLIYYRNSSQHWSSPLVEPQRM